MLIARADTVAERANEDALLALAGRDAPVPAILPLAGRSAARKRGRRLRFGMLLIGFDCAAILIAVALAALLRFGTDAGQEFGRIATITLPAYLLVAANGRAFRLGEAIQGQTIGRRHALLAFALSAGLILGAVFYIKASESFSRIVLGLVLLLGLAALAAGRALFAWLAQRWFAGPILHETVLLDGVETAVAPGSTVIDASRFKLGPRLDDPAMLDTLGRCLHGSDRVIVACPPERRQAWADALRGAGMRVEILVPELDRMRALALNLFGRHTTLTVAAGPLGHGDRALKRALDLAIVFGSAPLVLPVLLGAALAIRIESKGPALFVQQRVGQGNRLFRMLKLRTMRHEASDADGVASTERDDVRVTRVGAFLRRTSIDELPQLWNVLAGEMSVVGPRPHALGSRAADAPFWNLEIRYWDRHAAKPGMTGLAQVRGFRGSIHDPDALAQRVSSDLAYLQSWTIWRDLLIIGRTFRVLVHANAF